VALYGTADRSGQVIPMDPIREAARVLRDAERVLFITGAGISADSGLPTYRGIGGLYDDDDTPHGMPIEEVLSGATLRRDPALCWRYIRQIEESCRGASPNRAHQVLAAFEERRPHTWVLTQNVDGLHRRAGSKNVIDIHGDVHELACTCCCWRVVVPDYAGLPVLPRCPECEEVARPEVVLFGEMLPPEKIVLLGEQVRSGFDVVVSIGTTSSFPYIAGPVLAAANAGLPTIEINPGTTEVSEAVDVRIPLRAAEACAALWELILR
jgi:NAD-dependent deacetylase